MGNNQKIISIIQKFCSETQKPKALFLLIISLVSFSIQSKAVLFSTGTYVPYFQAAQVDTNGAKKTFELNPYFGLGTQFHMSGPQYFVPEFGYTYWTQNAKKVNKSMIFLHYNFGYKLSQKTMLRYGLSTHWYKIKGEGGTVTLRNGSGYTDFDAPSKEVISYFTTLNLGTEFMFKPQLSVRFDFNIMNPNKLEDRMYNYLLTFNFYR